MNIKILENKKGKIVFEIDATHTLCNLLKEELHNDDNVKVASYAIEHPLVGKPKMMVETSGEDAANAVINAAQKIKKAYEKLEKEISKELK